MKKIIDTATVLDTFKDAADKQAEATESGDYKTGNKCSKAITQCAKYLYRNSSIHTLKEFLHSSSVGVKLWSAACLLPIMEEEALLALSEISERDDIHAFTASITVREWQAGRLVMIYK